MTRRAKKDTRSFPKGAAVDLREWAAVKPSKHQTVADVIATGTLAVSLPNKRIFVVLTYNCGFNVHSCRGGI